MLLGGIFTVLKLFPKLVGRDQEGTPSPTVVNVNVPEKSSPLSTDGQVLDHMKDLSSEDFRRLFAAAQTLRGESGDQQEKAAERVEDAVEALEEVSPEDATAQTITDAIAALKQGQPALAEGIFRQIQDDRAQEGKQAFFEASEAARHRAALLYLNDKAKALEALQDAVRLWPENEAAQIDLGDVAVSAGNLVIAGEAFSRAHDLASGRQDHRAKMVADNCLGDVLIAQGKLGEALTRFEAGLEVAERLAGSDGSNSEWQRDLSVSYDRIGDVLVAQGKLGEALIRFEAGLEVAERLAGSDGSNSEWQRDLVVSYVKISEAVPEKAREMLTKALAIAKDLQVTDRLAPRDAWMIEELNSRLAALENG